MGSGHVENRRAGDVCLALGVGSLAAGLISIAPDSRTDLDPFGYTLVAVASLALAFRRQAPVPVLLVATTCVLGYQLLGYPGLAAGLPILVALYSAVRSGHRVIATVVTVVALAKGTAATLISVHDDPVRDVLEGRALLAGWLIASGVLGEVVRQHRAYLDQVEQRATEAERTREEAARRRAGEERLRIARELHDSLTHCISVIKVQAGVAVHLARKRGEAVPDALVAIEATSNEAMRELRSTLDVLRDGDTAAATSTRGVENLDALVAGMEQSGVPATAHVAGPACPLPPTVDRATYRIIQEALTNVARHAGPEARAQVHLTYGAEELSVRVDDDGRALPGVPVEAGMGLTGMRERVAALGGSFQAAARPAGGFRVQATLPTRQAVPEGHRT